MLIFNAVVLFPLPAMAEPDRITRRDVEAVLEAFGTRDRVVWYQASEPAGFRAAPADFFGTSGAIGPIPGSPWDGGHYCVDDWHVLLLGSISGGDQAFSRQDAEADLSLVNLTFTLTVERESFTLDTIRKAVKPVLVWEAWD